PLAELLDDLVAVAGLLGDERENHEPQLAPVEHAAFPPPGVAAARTPAAERPASEAMVARAAVAVVNIIVKMTMEHCKSPLLLRHITICRTQRYILISDAQEVREKNFVTLKPAHRPSPETPRKR